MMTTQIRNSRGKQRTEGYNTSELDRFSPLLVTFSVILLTDYYLYVCTHKKNCVFRLIIDTIKSHLYTILTQSRLKNQDKQFT